VDEGNNWINIAWGPLSLLNPVTNATLSNYGPTNAAVDNIPSTSPTYGPAPSVDFYGRARKGSGNLTISAGAVEVNSSSGPVPR